MNSSAAESVRAAQRRSLRARRASLAPAERERCARLITSHVAESAWLRSPRPIGLYVSVGSEVSTEALRRLALRRGMAVFLPRIIDYRGHRMVFARERDRLHAINRHGIPEPAAHETRAARWLSLLFLPLVGFNLEGARLGSGAGYYDRLLAFRRHRHHWHRPLVIGLAYDCQHLEAISAQSHDVALDAVVTEHGIHHFHREGLP